MTIDSSITLSMIVEAIKVRQPILNDESLTDQDLQKIVTGIGSLESSNSTQISFLSNPAYLASLPNSNAGVILVATENAQAVPQNSIAVIVPSPYLAYASVTQLFEQPIQFNSTILQSPVRAETVIHPTAIVADDAILGSGVKIGAYSVIGANCQIYDGTFIQSHVHIANDVSIGESCVIFPHVYIGHHCRIGNHVRIHPNATIGAEGFGFAPMQDTASEGWERIAQLGRVVIGDGVRIGSNSCVDRGAINDTVIEDNVIIDNLVQVGHNSVIGAGTAIAGKAGLAGSSVLGKRCMIGGAAGVSGHLELTDDVVLTGMTMATKTLKDSGVYSSGISAMPSKQWRRVMSKLRAIGDNEEKID